MLGRENILAGHKTIFSGESVLDFNWKRTAPSLDFWNRS